MADLRITDLVALPEGDVAATDVLPIADVSASETKKVTAKDLVEAGVALIDNGSIPAAKLSSISPASLGNSSAPAQFIAGPTATTGAFAARTIAAGDLPLATTSSAGAVVVGTGLGISSGTLSAAVATSATRGAVSVPSASGLSVDGSGVLSHLSSVTAQTKNGFTVNTTGHITAIGSIASTDLPIATNADVGGIFAGSGLSVTVNGQLNHADSIAAGSISGITYNSTGHITAVTPLIGTDLPVATTSVRGAVTVPTGALSVNGSGAITHNNSGVTAGEYTKVTVDARGHITAGTTLGANDIPEFSAVKLTSGTLPAARIGTKSILGTQLADYSTAKISNAAPTADYIGQLFFNPLDRTLFMWDGNVFQPIGVSYGQVIFAGTYDASTNLVDSVTVEGQAIGLAVGAALPAATTANKAHYVVVSEAGTGTAPAPTISLSPPDILLSTGTDWVVLDVSDTVTAQLASNVQFTPAGNISSANVQAAIQELDDEKLAKTGGTVTGELLIGNTGGLAFEGLTNNAYETFLTVVDPLTSDNTITLPDASGTVALLSNLDDGTY